MEEIEIIDRKNLYIFEAIVHRRRHPVWNKIGTFVTLHAQDWVNIIPVTKAGNIVLVEQYRQGVQEITIETPGGLVEPNEEPMKAAMRECKEETGYYSDSEPIQIARIAPNPAFLDNHCYIYLWKNCEKIGEQELDGNEDIRVFEASPKEIREMIKDGRINHSIALSALLMSGY